MMKLKNHSHESYDRKEKIVLGSDKKFGYTLAIVFFILCVSPVLVSSYIRLVFLIISVCLTAAALLEPARLHPLNKLWAQLGLLLSKIVSPVILAVLFFTAFLPVGLVLKLFKKDILNIKLNKKIKSYWIDSTQLATTSMKDQF